MTAISVSERLLEMAAFYTPLALTVTNNILLLHFLNVVVLIITMHFDNVPIWADQEMYLLM